MTYIRAEEMVADPAGYWARVVAKATTIPVAQLQMRLATMRRELATQPMSDEEREDREMWAGIVERVLATGVGE